jgi:hypothetical protein
MALNTLKALRSMVRGRIGEPVADEFSEQELNLYLSFGQVDVANKLIPIMKDWFTTSGSLTGGPSDWNVPSLCQEIRAITINGDPLVYIAPEDLGVMATNECFKATSSNRFYTHATDTITIFPSSSVAPVLYYVQRPEEMDEDTDVALIPIQFLDLVVKYAVLMCAPRLPRLQQIVPQLMDEYEKTFARLEANYVKRPSDPKLAGEPRK